MLIFFIFEQIYNHRSVHNKIQLYMKSSIDEQIQISEFIQDPTSLKLLILAGTNIKLSQLSTVSKCTGLIKLDLSSNSLSEIPLKFSSFSLLKILYLHDNQITNIAITKTKLEYISLFDNVIKNYRHNLIDNNDKLMGIDFNIVTKSERLTKTTPRKYSQIKWPIVEISSNLQQEEDYLNLLKAEVFVINQVYKKTVYNQSLENYLSAFIQAKKYHQARKKITDQFFFKKTNIIKYAQQWIKYTHQKNKLRKILSSKGKEYLLDNRLQQNLKKRSKNVSQVMQRFMKSLRQRMRARKIFEKHLRGFRSFIPVQRYLETTYLNISNKSNSNKRFLYFKQSQYFNLQKIFLYTKKMLFGQKKYDLCDHFDNLVKKSGRSYYIFRKNQQNNQKQFSFLLNMIKSTMNMVLYQKGIDRRHFLYNKKGHKQIQIKSTSKKLKKNELSELKERCLQTEKLLNRKYEQYDTLTEYEIKSQELYLIIIKLVRFFNAGYSKRILGNQAAYFQTEVIFDDKKQPVQENLYMAIQFYVQRVVSACIIQKYWRKRMSNKKQETSCLKIIKQSRAYRLINKWTRNLTFNHRILHSKWLSFCKSTWRETQLYIQIDIYMNLPDPTDLLRYKTQSNKFITKSQLYHLLHYKTIIEIVQIYGRNWVKIKYSNQNQAYNSQKQFSIYTYRYYFNGCFIKLFNHSETLEIKEVQNYEKKIQYLFKIKVNVNKVLSKENKIVNKIEIENSNPYFIWSMLQEGNYTSLFKNQEIKSLPISIFIYNKNKRPLKVNCDLFWAVPSSIYISKKKSRSLIRITPAKRQIVTQKELQFYLPHIKQHREKKDRLNSMKQHTSLLNSNRKRGYSQQIQISLLSQTLNIKRQ